MSQYKSSTPSSRSSRGYGDGSSAGAVGAAKQRQPRAQAARSMSGVHQAVSREQVEVRRPKPDSRGTAPAADDGWDWEAQPAAADFDVRGGEEAASPKRRKKKSWGWGEGEAEAEPYAAGGSSQEAEDAFGRRKKKGKARLAEAGPQMLDAPQYDDEYSFGGGSGSFASADTGSIEAPQYEDDGYSEPIGGGRRGFAEVGTQMLDAPQYDDADPYGDGAFSSGFAHEGTNLLDMSEAAAQPQQSGFAWPVSDARSGTQTLDAALDAGLMETPLPEDEDEEDDGEEKPKNFDVSEDASIEVVIWNLLRQIAYNTAVFLRDHVTPLRDSMDRYIERSKAIQENQNAAMSVQGRRLMRAAMVGTVLFVAGLSVYVVYDTKREKVPPVELAKLLYPYGPYDGTLNGKPFAGFTNVDFKYLQREPCSEGQTQANCYAYEYKAKNLENFSGKMIIGVNQDGQWMLFNPPKDLVAAAQARRPHRRR